jgi:hypothetical protein
VTNDAVTFRTRGDQTATLHPHQFLRRFLLHVLPKGFVKLRHYDLLVPGNVNFRLATARGLLSAPASTAATSASTAEPSAAATPSAAPARVDWRALFLRLTGIDLSRCPACGATLLSCPLARDPPSPPPTDTS